MLESGPLPRNPRGELVDFGFRHIAFLYQGPQNYIHASGKRGAMQVDTLGDGEEKHEHVVGKTRLGRGNLSFPPGGADVSPAQAG